MKNRLPGAFLIGLMGLSGCSGLADLSEMGHPRA